MDGFPIRSGMTGGRHGNDGQAWYLLQTEWQNEPIWGIKYEKPQKHYNGSRGEPARSPSSGQSQGLPLQSTSYKFTPKELQ
ncbi:MAG: hypothetical protein ABIJ45_03940 [Candidatus Zixiibacteriota bacterium]